MASELQEKILHPINQFSKIAQDIKSSQEELKTRSLSLKRLLYGLLQESSENLGKRSIFLPPGDPKVPYCRQELLSNRLLINHFNSVGEVVSFDEYVEEIVNWQPNYFPQVISILFEKAREYGYLLTLKYVPKKVREQLYI